MNSNKRINIYTIVFVGVLAAMVYVVTLFRFPLLGSKVHFANAVCLLSGMLLGPVPGGIAAGLGSAIYDAFGGYDLINVLITFVSKFAMAYVCGKILYWKDRSTTRLDRTLLSSVIGALTYVALYMLKTYIYNRFVYGYPLDAVGVTVMSKLIPSLINAGAAIVAAPIFYHAVLPALKAGGIWAKMNPQE
ncbi:MAG: ECF transporter S component [Clostridia bacterium]|nr:ECF transporter S component [Clostridia bacterium]